jgi:ubiquinone/menaquinone biosynthesis C-methylase UbiE
MQTQLKRTAETSRALGIVNRKKKNLLEAVKFFHEAVASNPKDHVSLINLAQIFDENKKTLYAVEYSMRAVLAAPDVRAYKEKFIDVTAPCSFTTHNADLQQALHICIESPDVNCSRLNGLWEGLMRLGPSLSAVYRVNASEDGYEFDKAAFDAASDYTALLDPFFLAGLKLPLVVGAFAFESFLTHLRRWLLLLRGAEKKVFTDGDYIKLTAALSHYCLFTDYIFYTTDQEHEKLARLREQIETAGNKPDERDLVIYACYEPLYKLRNAQELNTDSSSFSTEIAGLIAAQIGEYFDIQERRKSIVALTEIDDPVSKEVQEQYEEFPYPRWKLFPGANYDDRLMKVLTKKGARLLVAGCGTGQDPLAIAAAFPGLEILAVDLSRSSLAYAMRKAEEYGLENITFRQADILKLGSLGLQFDYIGSSGVLHHMKEPRAGLRVLCDILKPGGVMRLGLYSKLARQSVVAARKAVANQNYSNTAEGMRQFRRNSAQLLDKNVLRNLQGFVDYYNLPMCRDLIFHVHEHRYDTADIEKMLRECNLSFDTFYFPKEASEDILTQYHKVFPGDYKANDLRRWGVFEKKYPDAFKAMYQFWCHKV